MYRRECLPWAAKHASVFAPKKYEFIHFEGPTVKSLDRALQLQGHDQPIALKTSCRYLGVIIDKCMPWLPHLKTVEARAYSAIAAMRRSGNSAWGLTLKQQRQIYNTVVLPALTFACSAWTCNDGRKGSKTREEAKLAILRRIQKEAALVITSAFRRTVGAALDILAHTPPVEQKLASLAVS